MVNRNNGGNVVMANAWLVNNARTANNLARNEAVRRSRADAAEERAQLKAKKAAEAVKKEMNIARQAAVQRSKAEAAAERVVVIRLTPLTKLLRKLLRTPKRLKQMPKEPRRMPGRLKQRLSPKT